jgi:hypothetical protein
VRRDPGDLAAADEFAGRLYQLDVVVSLRELELARPRLTCVVGPDGEVSFARYESGQVVTIDPHDEQMFPRTPDSLGFR